MKILKIILTFFIFAAVYFFSYWMVFVHIFPESIAWAQSLAALTLASGASWLVWKNLDRPGKGVFMTALRWSAIAGGIGFCGGFFGPMIFAPGANQGPLLGLSSPGRWALSAAGLRGWFTGSGRKRAVYQSLKTDSDRNTHIWPLFLSAH